MGVVLGVGEKERKMRLRGRDFLQRPTGLMKGISLPALRIKHPSDETNDHPEAS